MFEKGDELLEEELGMGLGLGRRGKGREGGLGAWRGGGGTVEGEGGVVLKEGEGLLNPKRLKTLFQDC